MRKIIEVSKKGIGMSAVLTLPEEFGDKITDHIWKMLPTKLINYCGDFTIIKNEDDTIKMNFTKEPFEKCPTCEHEKNCIIKYLSPDTKVGPLIAPKGTEFTINEGKESEE